MIDLTAQIERIDRIAHVFLDMEHYKAYQDKHPNFNPRRHSVMTPEQRKNMQKGEVMGKEESEKALKENGKYSKAIQKLKKLKGSDAYKNYVDRNGEMFSPTYVIANAHSFSGAEKDFINDLYTNILDSKGFDGNPIKLNKDMAIDSVTALALMGYNRPITDPDMASKVQERIKKYDKGLEPDYKYLKEITKGRTGPGFSMEDAALEMIFAREVKGKDRTRLSLALAHVATAKLPFEKNMDRRITLQGCANEGKKAYGNQKYLPHGEDLDDNSLEQILKDNQGISHQLLGNMAGWWSYKKKNNQSLSTMKLDDATWGKLKDEYTNSMKQTNFSGPIEYEFAARTVREMHPSDFRKCLEGLKPVHNLRQEMGHIIDKHGLQGAELVQLSKYKGQIEKHKRMSHTEIMDELSKPPKARHFARSPAQLRQDFVSKMDPSAYVNSKGQPDPKVFQDAKQRVLSMPIGEFAAMLSAITSDEDEEGLIELSPAEFGKLGV